METATNAEFGLILFFFACLMIAMTFFGIRSNLRFLKGEGDFIRYSLFAALAKDEKTKKEMNEQEAKIDTIMASFFMFIGFLFLFVACVSLLSETSLEGAFLLISTITVPLVLLSGVIYYFYSFWKSEEKRKFIAGATFRIYNKKIDQLKQETIAWLNENRMMIIKEGPNTIEAGKAKLDIAYYDISIFIHFVQNVNNAFIIYDKKLARNYPIINMGIKNVLLELRNNLIRRLNGKEEIKINLARFFIIDYVSLFTISLFIFYLTLNKHIDEGTLSYFWPSTAVLFLAVRRIWFNNKIKKQASLPEYKVDEYKGVIEID